MKKYLMSLLFCVFAVTPATATLLFAETFDSLIDGTPVTITNTSLTTIRTSTAAGSVLAAESPGSLGTGTALSMRATSASTTGGTAVATVGFAPTPSITAFDLGTLQFSILTPASFTGSEVQISVGTGSTFNGASTGSLYNSSTAAQTTFLLRISTTGAVETYYSSVWHSLSLTESTPLTLSPSTAYNFNIVYNGSTSIADYEGTTVGAAKGDLYLNGTLVADDFTIRDGASTTAFTIRQSGSIDSQAIKLDNIFLLNEATTVLAPEPTTALLLIPGLLGAATLRRRRESV